MAWSSSGRLRALSPLRCSSSSSTSPLSSSLNSAEYALAVHIGSGAGADVHAGAQLAVLANAIQAYDPGAHVSALDASGTSYRILGVRFSESALSEQAETMELTLVTNEGISFPYRAEYDAAFPRSVSGSVFSSAERVLLTSGILDHVPLLPSGTGTILDAIKEGKVERFPLHSQAEMGYLWHTWIEGKSATNRDVIGVKRTPSATTPSSARSTPSAWAARLFLEDQPLYAVREYFGEMIALYFAFVSFYARSLLLPAIAGIALFAYQWHSEDYNGRSMIAYAALIAIWSTVFAKLWARRESALAHEWATLGEAAAHTVRPEHQGEEVVNAATGQVEHRETVGRQVARFFGVTVPVMAACLGAVIFVIWHLEGLRVWITDDLATAATNAKAAAGAGGGDGEGISSKQQHSSTPNLCGFMPHPWDAIPCWLLPRLRLLPTLLYAVCIPAVDGVNRRCAAWLTRFENHRTLQAHENAFIAKLILLKFANNFGALFYIGFYQQNLDLLRERLLFLSVVSQIVNNVLEVGLPVVRTWRAARKGATTTSAVTDVGEDKVSSTQLQAVPTTSAAATSGATARGGARRRGGARSGSVGPTSASGRGSSHAASTIDEAAPSFSSASKVPAAMVQMSLDNFDEFEDLLEMFMQCGIVTLFAAVFPLAAPFALLNNVFEVRSDAFKLLHTKRPMPKRVASLGPWSRAFRALGFLSVVTNSALIGIAAKQAGILYEGGVEKIILAAMVVEHVLFLAKILVDAQIPEMNRAVHDRVVAEAMRRPQVLRALRATAVQQREAREGSGAVRNTEPAFSSLKGSSSLRGRAASPARAAGLVKSNSGYGGGHVLAGRIPTLASVDLAGFDGAMMRVAED